MPYRPPSPYETWCPPALTDAAVPLAQTHRLLQALCEEHAGVSDLTASSPSRSAHDTLARFLEVFSQAAFDLGNEAGNLSYLLRLAAQDYAGTEQALRDKVLAESPRNRT
ncbi:MAG: hypothetical protein JWO22_221 [Frankiales bacterium]|nr:hypothetical protein [Frankiales bacterium]